MKRYISLVRFGLVLAVSFLVLAAAAGGTAPSGDRLMTLDDQYAEIARRVPGFAGVHYDAATGAAYISLRDPAYQAEAESAIGEILGPEVLQNRWQVKAVRWTDIDERDNRIHIGVGTVEGRAQVEAAINRARVPAEAVVIDLPEGALSEANPLAGCLSSLRPPAPEEKLPFSLKVSHEAVRPRQELTLTVEGAQPDQRQAGTACG